MKYLTILLLFFSFSAFAYENPYSDQKRWEAEDRFNSPQNFNSGQDAYYFQNQYDKYEGEQRRRAETDAYQRQLDNLINEY